MTFEFKNLGPIKEASIEMGKLTVVCGKNNTGKTYLTYGVWHVIRKYDDSLTLDLSKEISKLSKEIKENRHATIQVETIKKQFEKDIKTASIHFDNFTELHEVFNTNEEDFFHTSCRFIPPTIEVDFSGEINGRLDTLIIEKERDAPQIELYLSPRATKLNRIWSYRIKWFLDTVYISQFLTNPQLFCAERMNLHSMQYEVDKYKIKMQNLAEKEPAKFSALMEEMEDTQYPQPVEEHLDFIRNLEENFNEKSDLPKELLDYMEDFLGIKYQIIDDEIMIVDKKTAVAVPYHLSSSSVKTLADIYFWLKHYAKYNSLLMIDEPELSLHPENQIKLTRLLVKLVNAGIKVWITTHSDYIIKELNNCLMLENEVENKEKLMEEIGYEKEDILKKADFRMYIAHTNGTVERVATDEFGMVKSTFDEAMIQQNEHTSRIANAVGALLEEKTI